MRRLLSLAAAGLVVLAGCSSDSAASGGHHHAHQSTANGAPDRVIAGPQGRVPQFVVECAFSHEGFDDPIVHPGEPGASHLHVFFGNTDTDAASTPQSLLDGGRTTCNQPKDTAAYWAPALMRNGQVQTPVKSVAYYRAGPDVDPTTVQPYPFGLEMIAGDASATSPQPVAAVAWTCGTGIARDPAPPECPADRNLRLIVTFPDCWNGTDLTAENHIAHVAYSAAGACPADHPVPIPQLQFSVEYPVTGPTDGLELASGGVLSGHADFVNAWDPDRLQREVRNCLHRKVVCGVASGRTDG